MNLLSFFQFVGVHIEDHSDGSRVMLYYFKIWLSFFFLKDIICCYLCEDQEVLFWCLEDQVNLCNIECLKAIWGSASWS